MPNDLSTSESSMEARKRPAGSSDEGRAKRPRSEGGSSSEDTQHGLSDAALLYRFAFGSWQAANRLLTQAFVPVKIQTCTADDQSPMSMPHPYRPRQLVEFRPDQYARPRALNLLVIAIDALATAMALPQLVERERATIGLLFCQIGYQIVCSQQAQHWSKGKSKEEQIDHIIDLDRLLKDVQARLSESMAIAQSTKHLEHVKKGLEILNIRRLIHEGKHNAARQQAKQAYRSTDDAAHQYMVQFLLLEHVETLGPAMGLVAVEEIITAARRNGHRQVCEAASVARISMLFQLRRWDLLPAALDELGALCGWDEKTTSLLPTSPVNPQWSVTIAIHYLLYRCLWEGRMGRAAVVKTLRQCTFRLMDETIEKRLSAQTRAHGGLQKVAIHDASDFLVQTTPPNILYMLTYLVAMISGRDVTGRKAKAKTLVYANGLTHMERFACADDIWDTGFSILHDLGSVGDRLRMIELIQAEANLETALAFAYRSDYGNANLRLRAVIRMLRDHGMFGNIGSHVLLLAAQRAHLLGQQALAHRYYSAGLQNLRPGSDLGIVFSVGLLGNKGAFDSSTPGPEDSAMIRDVIDCAKGGSSLRALGTFVGGLLEDGVGLKSKIRTAWEATHVNGDKILYVLLYAFLASLDVSSDPARLINQAKTGSELAQAMGGLDRDDAVGQGSLGMWFAIKLSKLYRISKPEAVGSVKQSIARHAARNKELQMSGTTQ